jgi:hypothetical protein
VDSDGGWKPWKLPQAVRNQTSGGLQTFRILLPRVSGISSDDHRTLQRWLDLVDWEAETIGRSDTKIQEGIHAFVFQRPPKRIKSQRKSKVARFDTLIQHGTSSGNPGGLELKEQKEALQCPFTNVRSSCHANAIKNTLKEPMILVRRTWKPLQALNHFTW